MTVFEQTAATSGKTPATKPKSPDRENPEMVFWQVLDDFADRLDGADPADAKRWLENWLDADWFKDIDPERNRQRWVIRKMVAAWASTLRRMS